MTDTSDPTQGLVTNPAKETPAEVGINVLLPRDLHRALRIKSIQKDLSLTEAVIAAVGTWVTQP